MLKFISTLLTLLTLLAGVGKAGAQTAREVVTNLPADALALSDNYYNGQVVLDESGNEIGDVNDVLLDRQGQVAAVIVGVGGVLGAGEKNVGIRFGAFKLEEKDGKHYLILDIKKSDLETVPGFEFDRGKRRWVPAVARSLN